MMGRLLRRLPRTVRWALLALVVVVVMALLSLVTLARDAKKEQTSKSSPALVYDSERTPGEDTVRFRVPESRVPRTVQDAEDNAAVTLTPGRWEHDPENAGGGDVATGMPVSEREEVAGLVASFIKTWEAFPAFKTTADFDHYQASLRPLATADGLGAIIRRADNVQPSFVCPEPRCVAGSETVVHDGFAGPRDNFEVRAYDPAVRSAYIVAYGIVRYTGEDHPLAYRTFDRSYGLVVRKEGDRWLVARAAADTTGPSR